MFSRILVSVSDKTGLALFLNSVCAKDCEIVSTGGTAEFLRKEKFKVTEVSEVTGFPEMMDGRVRTLHPKIHMGLLSRSYSQEDQATLREYNVKAFDLVIVNLYPFEEAFKKGLRDKELIEKIDVGGPSMLRAAAKSFERLTVVCDPKDYALITEKVRSRSVDEKFRKYLASKVFQACGYYDSLISRALLDSDSKWYEEETLTIPLRKKNVLRYGENPHQKAVWYETIQSHPQSLAKCEILQGKELSYNNLVDLEAAVGAVLDFDKPACVIVKHATPCGVAISKSIDEAYRLGFEADSVSAFGGIVALNKSISKKLAQALVQPFLECIIAPAVDSDAREVLASKKNLRVLILKELDAEFTHAHPQPPANNHAHSHLSGSYEFKSLRGGALAQSLDHPCEWSDQFRIIYPKNETELSESVKADLIFAQRVVRHVKSNAIVVAKNLQTLGICGGQTNRVDSVKLAFARAKDKSQTGVVLASDAFFPFRDSIDLAAKENVAWIIQPGGSVKDQEVEAAAKEYGIGMVITKTRHFKH
jgi:phosphoribosylaminoimidazolecarboxamide formyltransferase/IMP cyclohydrolase